MYSVKKIIFLVIVFQNSIILSLSISAGTVSSDYGRVSNMPNDRIHVAAAMTIPDCIRLCVDFSKTYLEYVYEDCFAYNYEIDTFTCELIHSEQPANYIVGFQTRWITGLKN